MTTIRTLRIRHIMILAAVLAMPLAATGCSTSDPGFTGPPGQPESSHGVDANVTWGGHLGSRAS
jgi:hypothetical protein